MPAAGTTTLYDTGKALYTKEGCNGCHGANRKGVDGFAPSLLPNGPMKNYTSASFLTLMTTNVGYDGKKMDLPMAGKLKTDEINALYVYLSKS